MRLNTIIVPFSIIRENYILKNIKASECLVDNFIFDKFRMIFELYEKNGKKHEIKLSIELLPKEITGKSHLFSSEIIKSDCDGLKDEFQWIFGENSNQVVCVSLPPDRPEPYPNDRTTKLQIVLFACHYIMTVKRERVQKVSSQKSRKSKEKSEKGLSSKNRIYLLDEIVEYVHENGLNKEVLHKEINCPCWSVRGHYRHYKNGKTVFIKSYLKGKNKGSDKAVAKKYYV